MANRVHDLVSVDFFLARLRRNRRCMVQRVARAEPHCRQLAACSLQRSPAAVFATRTANIKQLLAKAE